MVLSARYVRTRRYEDYLKDVLLVHNFGKDNRDLFSSEKDFNINWKQYKLTIESNIEKLRLESVKEKWDKIVGNEDRFNAFRKNMLKCSILMPPLYVGQTNSLSRRLQQHINSHRDERDDFNERYNDYAENKDLPYKEVSDLIFVAITTSINNDKKKDKDIEFLTERLMMHLASPGFSIK